MREVMHAMAAEQRRQLVARLAASRRAKAERGGYAGGRPAFGYEAEGGELRIYEPEAQVVRWIFERVARDDWPIRKVARKLEERQALGRRWERAAVSRVLSREGYKLGPDRMVDPRVFNAARKVLEARRPWFGEQGKT